METGSKNLCSFCDQWLLQALALFVVCSCLCLGASAGEDVYAAEMPNWATAGINFSIMDKSFLTDKNFDNAQITRDKIIAKDMEPSLLTDNHLSKLDYSKYITLTGNQDGHGGCVERAVIHSMNIIKEMEHPYTPDLSYFYLEVIKHQLVVNEESYNADMMEQTEVEKYGVCTEASMPSDIDKYTSFDSFPKITDAIKTEASLYKAKISDPVKPSVEGIKSLLTKFGPLIADGPMVLINSGAHAVTIVGYDDIQKAFKCLNSWGDTWGNNGDGFFLLPYDKLTENLVAVRYIENIPSDRSSTNQAYSARIKITAPQRNKLIVKVGAVGKQPSTIWDTPNEITIVDDSETLYIDVPLPEYAASLWPPRENTWYIEVTNTGEGTAKVNEFTLAMLRNNGGCTDKFETETYSAQNLREVPAGKTVQVYIDGVKPNPGLPKGTWSGWKEAAGKGETDAALAAVDDGNTLYVFMKGMNKRIYVNSRANVYPATSGSYLSIPCWKWNGWNEVPGEGTTDAALSATITKVDPRKIYLIQKGINTHIYMNTLDISSKTWSGWNEIPGGATTDAALASAILNNQLYVFQKGMDNRIYYNRMDENGNWLSNQGWYEVPGGATTDAALTATAYNGKLYVFQKGMDNRIYYNRMDENGNWMSNQGWYEVPGEGLTDAALAATTYSKDVTVYVHQPDRLYLFHKGMDTNIYMMMYDEDDNKWIGWYEVPGSGFTDVAPAVTASASLYLFHKGMDFSIYYARLWVPGPLPA